jgi:protein-tyrosine phosphatase
MLIAWLVGYKNITLFDAMDYVMALRPAIDLPNRALFQLANLEVSLYDLGAASCN